MVETLNEIGLHTRNMRYCSIVIFALRDIRIDTEKNGDIIMNADDLLEMIDEALGELLGQLRFLRNLERKGETSSSYMLSSN